MKCNFFVLLVLIVGLLVSCNNSGEPDKESIEIISCDLSDAGFLLGNWKNEQEQGFISEKWVQLDDSTYYGLTFFVNNNDTVSYEEILLAKRNNELLYIPKVSNQNSGETVIFKRINSKPDRLVFENKEHDFPQKIIYFNISKDSIIAEISGKINGELKFVNFPMRKDNTNCVEK